MADNSKKPADDQDNKGGIEKAMDALSDSFNRLKKVNLTSKPAEQSDFFRAVKNNDAPAILKMLDSGFDPNSYNSSGKTALHVAVLANAREAAHLLVEHGANPLRGTQDDPNHRPLEDAVNFNKPEMVEFLARHGGYVPGARVNGWSLLHRACEKGKTRTVEALLKAGADCNEMTDNGSTPLLIAVKLGQFEVVKILLQFSEVVATMDSFFVKTDERKRSAFHLAVNSGKMPIIAAMLEKGANVNSRDATEKTPLLAAIENGNLDLVRLLAEAGADLNKSCGSHGTPLVHACAVKNMVGDDRRRAEMVDLLIRLGADTDIPSPHGRLPLHLVMTGLYEKEVLESLLRYPVNREIQDKFGLLPIHLAAMIKEMGYLPVLLEAGVDPNSRSTDDATTPLIHAVRVQNIEGVRLLLQAGANPKLYDAHGKSALSYARENRYDDIIEMLEQALKYNFVQTKPAPPKPGPHPSSGT